MYIYVYIRIYILQNKNWPIFNDIGNNVLSQ